MFYEQMNFLTNEDEKKYINEKSRNFSLSEILKDEEIESAAMLITEDKVIALDNIKYHMSSIIKAYKCLYGKEIEYDNLMEENDTGIFYRIVNNNKGMKYVVVNFPYIINHFQLSRAIKYYKELKELKECFKENMDTYKTYMFYYAKSLKNIIDEQPDPMYIEYCNEEYNKLKLYIDQKVHK